MVVAGDHMWNVCTIQIVKLSLELLSYDPNYNYESDDDDEGMDTDELEQDELYALCDECILGGLFNGWLGSCSLYTWLFWWTNVV